MQQNYCEDILYCLGLSAIVHKGIMMSSNLIIFQQCIQGVTVQAAPSGRELLTQRSRTLLQGSPGTLNKSVVLWYVCLPGKALSIAGVVCFHGGG